MEDQQAQQTVLWRERDRRCELRNADGGSELHVYVSDVLTYREPVRDGTGGLQQAEKLLAAAQEAMASRSQAD